MNVVLPARPILTLKRNGYVATSSGQTKSEAVSLKPVPRALSIWWPRSDNPDPLWAVEHPRGGAIFGQLPAICDKRQTDDPGPVYLLFGEHWGRHAGFGVVHILAGHYRELKIGSALACPSGVTAVADFVSRVITKRAGVYCEFADMRGKFKPIVVRHGSGTVVLEARRDTATGEPYYSVVTAFKGTNAKGSKIGALLCWITGGRNIPLACRFGD